MPNIFHLVINPAALEYYADIKEYVMGLKNFQYLFCCEHVGQSEKHYHMLLQLSKPLRKLSVDRLHGAHIKPKMFGSTAALKAYIACEDEKHKKAGVTAILIDEEGEMRHQGGFCTVRQLMNVKSAEELEDYRMYNTYQKVQGQLRNRVSIGSWKKEIQVYYIQGPSGIGKSDRAEEIIRNWYLDRNVEDPNEMFFDELKYDNNGFYAGVNVDMPTKVAIFDDFRAGNMKPEEFINLIDYRVHNLNVKGTSVKNNYELIVFTSVQKLSSIYKNVEDFERREQWERRITLIDLYPPERVHIGGLPVGYRTNFNNFDSYSLESNDGSHTIVDLTR